jgi:hypothetical protein
LARDPGLVTAGSAASQQILAGQGKLDLDPVATRATARR